MARKAVLRNLIKRQAREIFRQLGNDLPVGDYVVRLVRALSDGADAGVDVRRCVREELMPLFALAMPAAAQRTEN